MIRLSTGELATDSEELLRSTALCASPGGSFLSHRSAAAQLGGIVASAGEVHVGTATSARLEIEGIRWHRFKRSRELVRIRGLLCTTPSETFVDLGWLLSVVDLVVYADSLARHEPEVNHAVRDADGRVAYRLDLAYGEHLLVFEYDGRHHIRREGQWENDLQRRERLEAMGWRILVFVSTDLHAGAAESVQRIRAAVLAAGLDPGRPSGAWRRHIS